jgi:arylsulfatase
MADKAIAWMRRQNASAPEKPFFMYYATGTAHTPHHAPKDWIERYRGKFDQGWDAVRESTFARQKGLGIIPADSGLSPRPKSLPAWDSLTADQKRLYARMMEVHAGAISYMDAQVGRVIDEVKRSGRFDNTLVIFIEGDNGASAEGGLGGLAFEQSSITGAKESFAYQLSHIDDLGGPNMYNHFPVAWAWAMNSPFPWWKQVASQAGGVRNGMVVSWPARIKDKGALRSQYAFVSDIMPTVLEAAGVKAPAVVNGVPQQPIDGISLAYSFDDPRASSRRRTQIYEMMENFGIYKDGWMAGVEPKRAAWEVGGAADQRTDIGPDQRKWDLYNLETDFTTAKDLSAVYPAKLKAMQDLFWVEARKDNILPLHNWMQGAAGRPSLGRDRLRFEYPPGVTGISEDSAPHTIGRSFRIDAQVDLGRPDTNGVLITQGGRFGGYAFYLKDGRPVFHYNAVGEHQFTVRAAAIVPPGRHELSADFRADTPKPGAGGDLTLSVDGQAVASGRIGRTVMVWMSHTEGLDIGRDTITAISDDYRVEDSGFQGVIENVVVTVKP